MARLGVVRDIRGRVLNHAVQGVTDRHYTPYDFHAEKRSALDQWAAEVVRAVEGPRQKPGIVASNKLSASRTENRRR
jgi:hypothetical protein